MPDHPREADRVPLPEPSRSFLCTKCGHGHVTTEPLGSHPQCPKCTYLGFVICDDKFTADQLRAHADACVAAAVAQERERWQSELSVIHRTLVLETQAHKRSHEEALRLAERLRKYEPGKPMHLNAIRKDPQ